MKRVVALLGEDEVNRILEQEGKIEVGRCLWMLPGTIQNCGTWVCALQVLCLNFHVPSCLDAGQLPRRHSKAASAPEALTL